MEFLNVQQNHQGRFEVQGLVDPGINLKGFVGYVTCWERIKGLFLKIFGKATDIDISATGEKLTVNCQSFAKCLDRMLGLGLDLSKKYDGIWVKQQIPLMKARMVAHAEKKEEIKPALQIRGPNGPLSELERLGVQQIIDFVNKETVANFIESPVKPEIVLYAQGDLAERGCYFLNQNNKPELAISTELVHRYQVSGLQGCQEIAKLVENEMMRAIPLQDNKIPEVKNEAKLLPLDYIENGVEELQLLPSKRIATQNLVNSLRGGEYEDVLNEYTDACLANRFAQGIRSFGISVYYDGYDFNRREYNQKIAKEMKKGCYYFEKNKFGNLDKIVGIQWHLVKEFQETKSEERKKEIQALVAEQMKAAIASLKPQEEKIAVEAKMEKSPLNIFGQPWLRTGMEDLLKVMKKSEFEGILEKFTNGCNDMKIVFYPEEHNLYLDQEFAKGMQNGCYFFINNHNKPELAVNHKLVVEFHSKVERTQEILALVAEQMQRAIEFKQKV